MSQTLEQDLFDGVDTNFHSIMVRNKNSKLKTSYINPGLDIALDKLVMELELCQQCLSKFLEEKRYSFPRLYFIGDESLLVMLGHSKKNRDSTNSHETSIPGNT